METYFILDIILVVGSILACVVISFVAKTREKKTATADDFLLADRNMSVIPVAFSAFATLVSANNITTLVGETFANGMQFICVPVMFFAIQIPIAFYIIPVFHNMKYVSVYEYVEMRFDKSLRIFFSAIYLIINLVVNAVFLYVPAITVTTVTGVPYWITLVAAGLICSFYCVIGGLKAVIWTDVFQSGLMFLSVVIITIFAYIDVGGLSNAWSRTFSGKSHQHFTFSETLDNSYSFWNLTLYATTHCFYTTIGSQACAQRFLCVKDYRTARNAFLLSNLLGIILHVVILFTCVAVFAALTTCNPLEQPGSTIQLPDQIYIFVAAKLFEGIPGVLGIILAGLISAALSSVSSTINALSANVLEDYIIPLIPSLKSSERKKVILCRVLTAMFGCLTVAIGLVVPEIGGVIHVLLLVTGALAGPIGGILFLAFFYRKTNTKACKLSLVVAFAFSLWLSIGSFMYFPHRNQFKHDSDETCIEAGILYLNSTNLNMQGGNETIGQESKGPAIYGLSAFWFPVLSVLLSAIGAIIIGLFLAPEKPVDIRLLSPLILTTDEIKSIENSSIQLAVLKINAFQYGIFTNPDQNCKQTILRCSKACPSELKLNQWAPVKYSQANKLESSTVTLNNSFVLWSHVNLKE